MLSEISQSQILPGITSRQTFKKVKLTDAESREVVAKGWWVGEIKEKIVKGYKLSAISSENPM